MEPTLWGALLLPSVYYACQKCSPTVATFISAPPPPQSPEVDSYYEIICYEIQQLCDCVLTVLMRKHPLVTNVSSVEGGFCTQ